MAKIFMKSKRLVAIAFTLLICISLNACDFFASTQTRFNNFLEGLPTEFISNDSLDINFLFVNPTNFGFKEKLLELPYSDMQDYKEGEESTKQLLKKLKNFDRKSLSEAQRLTYDVLEDYLNRSTLLDPYYYFTNSYLGSIIGFQAQLPLLLNEFNFDDKHDLDSYYNMIETSGEKFLLYADLEKQRQVQGVGMSQTIIDKVIEQCDNFTDNEDIFLIDSVNARIDVLEFLTAEEKTTAKKKNEELLKTKLVEAYKLLRQELSTIKASDQDVGLSGLPNGKEYYEALLQQTTGVDMTVEQVREYINKKIEKLINEMDIIIKENPDIYKRAIAGEEAVYSEFKSVEENIAYLQKEMLQDYPPIENIKYRVFYIPKEMEKNFSPAAYMLSRIDEPVDYEESIYINGEYNQSIFPTIAHEGYPGHMYQHVFYKSLKMPTVRYLIDYDGYSEGWATYAANNSYKYSSNDYPLLLFWLADTKIEQCRFVLMDIGIHYDDWTRAEFTAEVDSIYGVGIPQEDIDSMFDVILETPVNDLSYYLTAMQFQDMYDTAETELGDKFSSVELNRVILETGPASFDILWQQIERHINEIKGEGN